MAGALDITLECSDAAGIALAQAAIPVATDNCDVDVTNIIEIAGAFVPGMTCPQEGTYTNTWTVTDACGNISEVYTQVITITDNTAPTWTTMAGALDASLECSDAAGIAAAQALIPVASDNCDGDVTNIVEVAGAFVPGMICPQEGTYTNTWTVTDACGNVSQVFTQVITITDNTAPTWTTAAGTLDATLECSDAAGIAAAQALIPVATDNCDGDVANIVEVAGAFVPGMTCPEEGTYTNTWTVTDACGNISGVYTQVITITDNTSPTWTTMAGALDVTLECSDAAGIALAQAAIPVATDNCDGNVANIVEVAGAFVPGMTCPEEGTYTNTWTVTDACGNISNVYTQVITITDNTAPTWTTMAGALDVTLECSNAAGIALAQAAIPVASDNCDGNVANIVEVAGAFVPGMTCPQEGTYTNTWTVTDACGNISAVYTQVITITDNTSPVWSTVPGALNATLECSNAAGIALAQAAIPVATDNCDGDVSNIVEVAGAFVPGITCDEEGTYTNTWTVTDACGNISAVYTQVISIFDDTAPVIMTGSIAECYPSAAAAEAASLAATSATDNCTGLVTFAASTVGICSAEITVTATDPCGNQSFTSYNTRIDNQAPVITATSIAPCYQSTAAAEAAALLATSATDDCLGTITFEASTAGTCSAVVTVTATDECGNQSMTTYNTRIDNAIPILTPGVIASCYPNAAAAEAAALAATTVTDDCLGTITYSTSTVGTCSAVITVTATDGCGNVGFTTYNTRIDNTSPVINPLPAPVTINCPTLPAFATAVATDACSIAPVLTFVDVTTPGACAGNYSVTRTWTATDECGNTSTASQTINVQDVTAPVFDPLPAPSTINCPAVPSFATPVIIDACGSSFTLTHSDQSTPGGCAGAYSVTRTWIATDGCGNSSSASQTINVQDVTGPVISTLPAPSTINCPATPSFVTATATDACGSSFSLNFADVNTPGDCPGEYSVTRTWTAIDACGNSSTAAQTITVQDVTPPMIFAVPPTATISCPSQPQFSVAASDGCGFPFTLSSMDSTIPGDCPSEYTITRIWTATDLCGNAATASQSVTVQDITAPVIAALPAPTTINCPLTPSFAVATATDACGSQFSLTYTDATVTGDCAGEYSVTRTWTALDVCGNSSTKSQTIHVIDTDAPVIATLPAPSTIQCPSTPAFAVASVTDACGSAFTLTYNDVTTSGDCAGEYSVTRTWTATDACGNVSNASQTIHVIDVTAPVIASLPPIDTIDCPATPVFAIASATDACGSAFTLIYNDATVSGACNGEYTTTRTWTATDACGNIAIAAQIIHVQDVTAPVIATLPLPDTIDCPGLPVFAMATATDECASAFTLLFEDTTIPGACSGYYSAVRTWTATDDCDNVSTAVQVITVQDTTAPVINALPAPSTIECPAAPVFAVATASDLCGSSFTLVSTDQTTPGECAGEYSLTRTWTATDQCGNSSTAAQTIHVIDVSAPVIAALPAPTTINCPATPSFTQAIATDACASSFTLTYSDVTTNGECAGEYDVTRTWTATDACGNASTASQTIHVIDTDAPVIGALPATSTINCPSTPSFATATATDACGSAFTLEFADVTALGDCAGEYTVTRTWTATDDCGNVSTKAQVINVIDTDAPVIAALPAPSTINCPSTPSFAVASATDACGSAFSLVFNDVTTNGDCAGEYSVTRTWTATDDCGNISTASQTIHVIDTDAPVIDVLPAPSLIDCPATPVFAIATATDACGSAFTLTYNDVTTLGDCAGEYAVTRTWTATDACGNASTSSQTINVQDITAPVFDALPGLSTINCPATPSFATATATDNCGSNFSIVFDDVTTNGDCTGEYSVTRTWTATDDCGNVSIAAQTINVQDVTAPVIAPLPAVSTIDCPATPSFATASATDDCGSAFSLVFNDVTTFGDCAGEYSVTRTWTATDDCGNISTASQTIHVQDVTAPVIDALPDTTTINCPAVPSFATAVATDNCGSAFSLLFADVTTNGDCAGEYSVTRTWTATDDCGNISTASQTIHVQDVTAPVFNALPAPTTINCPATPAFETAVATDNCGSAFSLVFNDVTTLGDCAGEYSVTRTWTATDDCGNISTTLQTIHVQDVTAPVINSLPAPSTINCPATPSFATATASDNCGSAFSLVFNDVTTNGDCAGEYSVTRTWTATDDCGNVSNASQTINVQDVTGPVIASLPAPSVIHCPAVPSFAQATATDGCGSSFTLNFADQTTPGVCAGEYVVTRTWTATDACLNSTTATQVISVVDDTPPSVTGSIPLTNVTGCSASNAPAAVTTVAALEALGLSISDACANDASLTVTSSQTSAGTCPIVVTRTYVITDLCGNSSTAVAIIHINDTTPPVGSAPPGSFSNNVCLSMAVVAVPFNATVLATYYTDNCGGPVTAIPVDTTLIGDDCGWIIIYAYKVVDICGNALLNQNITHSGGDLTAPTGMPPMTSLNNNACKATAIATYPFNPVTAGAGYTDNCGASIIVTLTNTQLIGNDCSWAIIYTFSVKDQCNNALNAQQMVISGGDHTPPSFTRPPDITIFANELCQYNATVGITGDVTNESDGCSSSLNATFTDNVVNGSCACSYIISRTWHLVDACGNAAPNQVQTIYVYSVIVTNNNDSGPGSLREVVSCAPAGSTITFAPSLSGNPIVLTSGEITIDKDLTITGVGLFDLMISGNNASRIFHLQQGKTLTVAYVALKNASAATNGGAIYVEGNLRLNNILLQNNKENGLPKAMTLTSTGSFEAMGTIQIMN